MECLHATLNRTVWRNQLEWEILVLHIYIIRNLNAVYRYSLRFASPVCRLILDNESTDLYFSIYSALIKEDVKAGIYNNSVDSLLLFPPKQGRSS
jgi:hypothetical protein